MILNSPDILIAEDEPLNRDVMKQFLIHKNFTNLRFAENGQQALDMVRVKKTDLLLLDVMMPEINGIQLANQLKNNELTAHIPILFLSAKGSIEHKLEGLAKRAEDYNQKTFNIQENKLKIRNLLETRNLLIEKFKKDKEDTTSESPDSKYLSKVNSVIQNNLDNSQFSVDLLCTELAVG